MPISCYVKSYPVKLVIITFTMVMINPRNMAIAERRFCFLRFPSCNCPVVAIHPIINNDMIWKKSIQHNDTIKNEYISIDNIENPSAYIDFSLKNLLAAIDLGQVVTFWSNVMR